MSFSRLLQTRLSLLSDKEALAFILKRRRERLESRKPVKKKKKGRKKVKRLKKPKGLSPQEHAKMLEDELKELGVI